MFTSSYGQDSPYGPFVKTGRGGAGNFNWKQEDHEKAHQQQASDPEAQTPQDLPLPSVHASPESQYLPTGRGGAGNYMTPSEREAAANQASPIQSTSPTPFSGRGGAGNFASNSGNAKSPTDTENTRASEQVALERRIQEDVELGLKRPEGAHIPVPEGREIGS